MDCMVSGGFLQTAQTWPNAGVCSVSCALVFGSVFVYYLVVFCCCCFTGNLDDWLS